MKLSQPLKLGIALLGVMLAAGLGSGVLAYKIGYESIKGINQPNVNPTKKFTNEKKISEQPKPFIPINEKTIIKTVEAYIRDGKAKPKPSSEDKSKPTKPAENQKPPEPSKNNQAFNVPIKTKVQGVSFEVVQTTQQGSDLWLDVQLKNEGTKTVNFLYNFLEIKDSKGQVLSAIIDGLPEALPANGETFTGTIKIPMVFVETKQLLSIRLADYPGQKLELNLKNIPFIQ